MKRTFKRPTLRDLNRNIKKGLAMGLYKYQEAVKDRGHMFRLLQRKPR